MAVTSWQKSNKLVDYKFIKDILLFRSMQWRGPQPHQISLTLQGDGDLEIGGPSGGKNKREQRSHGRTCIEEEKEMGMG
jgi:hypothetical protein